MEKVGHEPDQVGGGQRLPARHPFVYLQLETGQGGHDEKVAVKVRHRLFQHREPECGIAFTFQQVGAHQRLVKVGSDFGHEERVASIDKRLVFPGEVRVHRVTQFVSQRAEAEDVVSVAHKNIGMGIRDAAGVGARTFTQIGIAIDPSLPENAAAHGAHILVAQRFHPFADPLSCLLERDLRFFPGQRRLDIVDVQLLQAHCLPPETPVTVPERKIAAEGVHRIVEDGSGNVIRRQGRFQGGAVVAGVGLKHVLLDAGRQKRGHCIFVGQVGIGVILPGSPAQRAIRRRGQGPDVALGYLDRFRLLLVGIGRLELEVGIGQHPVAGGCRVEGVEHLLQQFLHLGRAHVRSPLP